MKRIVCILAVVLLTWCAMAQDAATLAREGDDHYRTGDYEAAIESYESALATGRGDAVVFYNLGNAYYRMGETARAILNYERALRLKPSMKEAKENLELANGQTVDRITDLPEWFGARWWETLCTKVTPRTWRIAWLVLLALLAAVAVVLRIGRDRSLRRWSLLAGVPILLLLVLTTVLMIDTTKRYNAHSEAIVMQESVSIKGSPERQSVDKMILHAGTKVHIGESLQGWEKITIADGTTGWCESGALERI